MSQRDLFALRWIGPNVYLRLLTVDDAPLFLEYLKHNRSFHEPYVPLCAKATVNGT